MKKVPPWLPLICLAAVLCAAQDVSNSGAAGQNTTSQSGNPNANQTISGCLSKSGGNYILTDAQSGTVYTLTGNTDQLSAHVGHEVEINGQPGQSGTANANTNPGSATSGGSAGQIFFQVSGVQHLSDHCGSASNGPGASSEAGAAEGSTNPNAGLSANAAQTSAVAPPPNTAATADTNARNRGATPFRSGSNTNTETPGMTSSPAAANSATGTQAAAAAAPSQENPGSSVGASPGTVPAYGQPATAPSVPFMSGATDMAQNRDAPSISADQKKATGATQGNDVGTGQSGKASRHQGAAPENKASIPNTGSDLPLLGLLGFASTLAGIYLRKQTGRVRTT